VPFDAEQLDRTVREALRRSKTSTRASQVVAFLPAKAGAGATTLAVHTARAAATKYQKRTLLIEADQQSGSVGYLLHLEPSSYLGEAIDNRALDDQQWKRLVSKSHGMDILPASAAPHAVKGSRWDFYRLLKFARQEYEVIVVDMAAQIDDVAESILSEANDAILVATSEPASLCMVRRRLWELEARGARHRHLRLLVNRYAQGDWDEREMAAVATREVSAVLPEDSKALRAAVKTNGLAAANSAFDRQVVAFCGQLLPAEGTVAAKGPGLLDRCMEAFGWGVPNGGFRTSAQPRLEANGDVYRSSGRR
jgi:Flp pilus assembly CpaE family ATPase